MYTNNGKHLEDALLFIKTYDKLANCHLVDFITEDLWNKCLPDKIKNQIQKESYENVIKIFTNTTNDLNLKNNNNLLTINNNDNVQVKKEKFMKDKKSYEIDILSNFISGLCKEKNKKKKEEDNIVIDVGAGKGYLGTSLSENYAIPVLSIDSCPSRNKSALKRQKLLKKIKNQSFPLARHLVEFINEETDYVKYVKLNYPEWNCDNGNLLLVGLHTCGSLAHSMIKSFLQNDSLKIICTVPCCYHLTEETLFTDYFLSKNARMLAQQSVERNSLLEKQPIQSSIFYRAILQVLFKSLDMENVVIGRGGAAAAAANDFPTYAKWAFKKIGFTSDKIPTDSVLCELYNKYSHKQWQMNIFQRLRVHLGSVIETALVLDRILYLERSEKCSRVCLVRIFEAVLSPRCYAIVAFK